MIFLMSAAVGFIAHWLFLYGTYNVLGRKTPLPPFRPLFVGIGATVLFSVAVWTKLHPHDSWLRFGAVILSVAAFMFSLAIFKLLESATELLDLRALREKTTR